MFHVASVPESGKNIKCSIYDAIHELPVPLHQITRLVLHNRNTQVLHIDPAGMVPFYKHLSLPRPLCDTVSAQGHEYVVEISHFHIRFPKFIFTNSRRTGGGNELLVFVFKEWRR